MKQMPLNVLGTEMVEWGRGLIFFHPVGHHSGHTMFSDPMLADFTIFMDLSPDFQDVDYCGQPRLNNGRRLC